MTRSEVTSVDLGPAERPPGGDIPWQRLHPLSPVVRAGRGLIGLVIALAVLSTTGGGSLSGDITHVAILVVVLIAGVISWAVTRWRIEGGVLRIDGGLIRRRSDRLPVSQIQAVDVVRPGLARVFRLAELRIRLAGGSGSTGRLAYLTDGDAERVRARLLALAHGVHEDTPPPPERPLFTVPTGRLIASTLLSTTTVVLVVGVAALVVLEIVAPSAAVAAAGSSAAVILLSVGAALLRRVNAHWRLTVAEAPDGLRLRAGLVETSAETIPRGRVQAVRMVQPVLWRPFGWRRLIVDVAGQRNKGRQDRNAAKSQRDLLPVGTRAEAEQLLAEVLPESAVPADRPPGRARWKSPLRYRHLSWGWDAQHAVVTGGRFRLVTDWVPLEKVQSVRRAQGPVQRRLGLASIHLDTAGRRIYAVARDRSEDEASEALALLPEACRAARRNDTGPRLTKTPSS